MKKKILFVVYVGISGFLLQACDGYFKPFNSSATCGKDYPELCSVSWTVSPNPYPLSLQGGVISLGTGRGIGAAETVEVVLSQGDPAHPKTIIIKNEQVNKLTAENSVRISLFQPDLMDFNAGTATLTLTLIPYEGATPQVHVVNLQLN